MKKLIIISCLLFITLFTFAQSRQGKNRVTVTAKNITVNYVPLNAKGKAMFGDQVPYGNVWPSSGKVAEVSLLTDTTFGGLPVKAGNYSLFAIPGEKEWVIILNASVNLPADFKYEEIKDKDVLKVTVPVFNIDNQIDKLTFRFTDSHLIIEWAHTQVAVPLGS